MNLNKLKYLSILWIVSAVMVVSGPVRSSEMGQEDALDSSWYVLPENGGIDRASGFSEFLPGKKKLIRQLDNIFQADAEALDRVEALETKPNQWRLTSIVTGLAISAKGILAPISLKGTAACNLFWRKKNKPETRISEPSSFADSGDSAPDLTVSGNATRDQLDAQLEPAIRFVIKSKKITDETEFRKNIRKEATRFFELTEVLNENTKRTWWTSRLRIDVWFNFNGKINLTTNAGADFKFRFEWYRVMPKPNVVSNLVALDLSDNQKQFKEFVDNLVEDAEMVSYETFKEIGFYPNAIRPGLGFSIKGKLGIVKFGGGVNGYVVLSTDPPKPGARIAKPLPSLRADGLIPLIENSPKESHLTFARSTGVTFDTSKNNRGIIDEVIYKLDRRRFRQGLKRAVLMSSHFADRAEKIHIGKWQIHEIRPFFELSIGGDMKFVSISGMANVELSFLNKSFLKP